MYMNLTYYTMYKYNRYVYQWGRLKRREKIKRIFPTNKWTPHDNKITIADISVNINSFSFKY